MTRLPRRGIAAIWLLVVLSILSAILAAEASQFAIGRRMLHQREKQLQAYWLARSGIERAAARLLSNPTDYQRESVALLPEAEVRISVQAGPAHPDSFVVTSEARYRINEPSVVVRSLTHRFRRVIEDNRVRLEYFVQE